jgi:hypothetical protein
VAGTIGFVLVWFSQAAVLVLAGLGVALVLRWVRERDRDARRPVMITVPIWAVSALVGLVVAQHHMTAHTAAFMYRFWGSRQGFLPLPPHVVPSVLWTRDRVVQFFDFMSHYPWPMVYSALAIVGIVRLCRRKDVGPIVLAPLAVTFAAAVAQQYPFRARLVLFLLPVILIASAAAVEWLRGRAASVHPVLGTAIVIAALVPPLYAIATPPPYTVEPFKPVLAYVQAHRQVGDAVYVYTNAYEAIDRYGARYGLPAGSYVLGICDEWDIRPFLADVDQFRGSPRVWVIGSSVPDFAPPRQAIRRYLQTIGVRRDSVFEPSVAPLSPVSAELFDLSDSARLHAASAATFRVEADTLRPLCYDWIRPTRP